MGWVVLWGAAMALRLSPADVVPAAEQPALRWTTPPGCPSQASIEAAVEEHIGRTWSARQLRVEGTVRESNGGYALDLRIERDDAVDVRQLDARTCGALARATALLVSLSLDPVAVTLRAQRATASNAGHDVVPEPARIGESTAPPPARVRREAPRPSLPPPEDPADAGGIALHGVVDAGLEVGALPGPTGLISGGAAVTWPRVRLELSGVFAVPRTHRGTMADVQVLLGGVAARACARLRTPRIEVPLCGGIEGGVLRGRGTNAPRARTALGRTGGVSAGVGLVIPVAARVALRGRVEAVALLVRPSFEVRDPGDPTTVFLPGAVSGRALAGVEIKIAGPGDGNRPSRRRGQ